MRTLARLTLTALALSGLVACGAQAPPDDEAETRAQDSDAEETVFDDMIQTQDRARAVEDLTLGRKSDLDEALEQAEGDEATDER
jgi:hypothetical protein